MAWSDIASNETFTGNELQLAVNAGTFTIKSGQSIPNNNENLTKDECYTLVNIQTISGTELAVKSDLVAILIGQMRVIHWGVREGPLGGQNLCGKPLSGPDVIGMGIISTWELGARVGYNDYSDTNLVNSYRKKIYGNPFPTAYFSGAYWLFDDDNKISYLIQDTNQKDYIIQIANCTPTEKPTNTISADASDHTLAAQSLYPVTSELQVIINWIDEFGEYRINSITIPKGMTYTAQTVTEGIVAYNGIEYVSPLSDSTYDYIF